MGTVNRSPHKMYCQTHCLGYNTVPAQTDAHENHLLIAQQQQLQQLIDAQTIQVRAQQQEIEAARHFGRL